MARCRNGVMLYAYLEAGMLWNILSNNFSLFDVNVFTANGESPRFYLSHLCFVGCGG